MIVTSRSYDEYRAFFALTDEDLRRRILDCAGGASGFAAVAGAAGTPVTAVDPLYADLDVLRPRMALALTAGDEIVERHDDRFVWDWYGTPERRSTLRRDAMTAFTRDLGRHPGRYVAGALPDLPFPDEAFDIALCSHLLFTWSDTFDRRWHDAALRELARVAAEVRVFPLILQGDGRRVLFLPRLLGELRADGYDAEIRRVPYRFQLDGDEMLILRRPPHRP